jgi:peptidoglycan/xylan/chitin deacetylase (PgdA/CDA1 family)
MTLLKDLFFTVVPKRLPNDRAVILMYHSISDADYFSAVLSHTFESQMKYLAERKFPVISLAELVRRLEAGEQLGGAVAITFDDGYLDNLTTAYPVLKKYGFQATVFVETGKIGQTDERGLKRIDSEQLVEIERGGLVSIEPHSVSHPKLSTLSRPQSEIEIHESKRTLESLLHKTCRYFATPFGAYTQETMKIMQEAGIKGAVSVREGTVGSTSNPLELPRVSIDRSTTMAQFKGKLSTAVDWYQGLKP